MAELDAPIDVLGDVTARRAGRDIAFQLISRLTSLALGIVVTLLVVRTLGDSRFGQWSTILAVAQIAQFFGDLGLEQVAVRKAAEDREREHEWIGALVTLRIVLAIPALVIALVVLMLLATSGQMREAALVFCSTMLLSPLASTRTALQLRVRNTSIANVELANSLIWGAAVILLSTRDAGLVAFAVAFLAASAITTGAQVVLALRVMPIRLRGARRHWGELLRVGLPVAVSTILIIAYARIDQVLIFEINGEQAAGLYGAAYRILDRATLLPGTIMGTLFPMMAAAHTVDRERLKRLVQVSVDLLLTGALPVFAFTAVAAPKLVHLLFGDEFASVDNTLIVLMASYVVTSIGFFCGYLIIILELQRRFVRYALAALVLNVGLNLLLLERYGIIAAAWLTLASELLVVGLAFRDIRAALPDPPAARRPVGIAIASGVMAGAVALLQAGGVPLGGLVVAAAAVYPAALLLTGGVDRDEVGVLLRRGSD